jgi:fructose transport system substrate-binding protein
LVYTINEPAAAGAFNALKKAGKEKNVLWRGQVFSDTKIGFFAAISCS